MAETTAKQLRTANEDLRRRLAEAEQALEAIRTGQVESLVVDGPNGPQIFSLEGATQSYRVLVEAMSEGAARVAEDGRILYCNAALARLLRAPLEQVMGGLLSERVPERYQTALNAVLKEALVGETRSELRLVDQEGQEVPIHLSASAIVDEGRKVICLVVTGLAEQKRNEEVLRQTVANLEASNRELEHFAYLASHDLQEPLRVVTSYVQLLERRYKDKLDADASDFIGFAVGASARMQALISDLLDYSRIGTRAKPMAKTDVGVVLNAARANLQMAIEESGATIDQDPMPTVWADAVQLLQLWQNLLGNAIKFRGSTAPTVHVSATHGAGQWTFAVRDNGIGIAPEHFEQIFLPFRRLHGVGDYPGTGIGLATAKKIVERHGGRIWVESEPGRGSVFFFTLADADGRP